MKQLPYRAFVVFYLEFLFDNLREINTTPPHKTGFSEVRTRRDYCFELGVLLRGEPGTWPRRFAILQPSWPFGIKSVHPVSKRLAIHQPHLRRLSPAKSIQNTGKRHQPPRLFSIIRLARQRTQVFAAKVRPQFNSSQNPIHPFRCSEEKGNQKKQKNKTE